MADMIRTVLVEQKMIYEERIAQLTRERDEARRMACEKEAWLRRENGSARDHAERMGWDCFKDNP